MTTHDKIQSRTARIEQRKQGGKTVYEASLSSEQPVKRYGYTEVLRHDESSINMERARNGLVLLFNHDVDKPIGRVTDIGLRADNKLAGRFTFSDTEQGRERQKQVDEGVLTDISIRYAIHDEQRDDDDDGNPTYTVTNWELMEASVVSVPADSSVGIGRSVENIEIDSAMDPTAIKKFINGPLSRAIQQANQEAKPMTTPTPKGDDANNGVVSFESARKAGATEGIVLERQRVQEINDLFAEPGYQSKACQALRDACIAEGTDHASAMKRLLGLLGSENASDTYVTPQPKTEEGARASQVRITEAGEDKQLDGMRKAMDVKLQIATKDQVREFSQGNDFVGMGLAEMARHTLIMQGVENPYKLDIRTAVGYALNPNAMPYGSVRNFVGHGTSVFANLVENSIGKQLLKGFEEAGETWSEFCQVGSVSSFRAESRIDVSEFPDLDTIPENGEYTHGTMSDSKESIQAVKKGKLMSVTREVIINDDLMALSKIPRAMGRSAARAVGDDVYSILTTNAAMSDGVALFHASHSNLLTSGGAPSVSELDAMELKLALQTDQDSNGNGQNIDLAVLVVPRALKKVAQVLAQAVNDPDQISTQKGGGGTRPNPYAGAFKVVSDARLDATSAAVYYGMGDPARYDTIEVGFLNGQQAPYVESQDGFTVDGITYKVRHEYGVKATSWRAMVKTPGA